MQCLTFICIRWGSKHVKTEKNVFSVHFLISVICECWSAYLDFFVHSKYINLLIRKDTLKNILQCTFFSHFQEIWQKDQMKKSPLCLPYPACGSHLQVHRFLVKIYTFRNSWGFFFQLKRVSIILFNSLILSLS